MQRCMRETERKEEGRGDAPAAEQDSTSAFVVARQQELKRRMRRRRASKRVHDRVKT